MKRHRAALPRRGKVRAVPDLEARNSAADAVRGWTASQWSALHYVLHMLAWSVWIADLGHPEDARAQGRQGSPDAPIPKGEGMTPWPGCLPVSSMGQRSTSRAHGTSHRCSAPLCGRSFFRRGTLRVAIVPVSFRHHTAFHARTGAWPGRVPNCEGASRCEAQGRAQQAINIRWRAS